MAVTHNHRACNVHVPVNRTKDSTDGYQNHRSLSLVWHGDKLRNQMRNLDCTAEALQGIPDKQVSLTDPDARSMASQAKGTGVAGYNVQVAVDTKHRLIVAHEVTKSVMRVYNAVRRDNARRFLENTRHAIFSISEQLGFDSSRYFMLVFSGIRNRAEAVAAGTYAKGLTSGGLLRHSVAGPPGGFAVRLAVVPCQVAVDSGRMQTTETGRSETAGGSRQVSDRDGPAAQVGSASDAVD